MKQLLYEVDRAITDIFLTRSLNNGSLSFSFVTIHRSRLSLSKFYSFLFLYVIFIPVSKFVPQRYCNIKSKKKFAILNIINSKYFFKIKDNSRMQNGFKTLIRKVYYPFDKFSIILIERSKKKMSNN